MIKNVAIGPIYGEIGGVPQHVLNIIKYSKHNFSVIRYSPLSFYYPRYRGIGYFFTRHPSIPFFDPYGLYMAKKILPRYDIVHTHGHPYWWDLYRRPKNARSKYIHTIHQIYLDEDTRSRKEWVMRKNQNRHLIEYCKSSDAVISVAKHLQKHLREVYNINSLYIPNGINFEEIRKAQPQRFRKKYNINDDFLLYVGYINKVKRPELFLELAERIPENLFVMIGRGLSKENLCKLYGEIPKNLITLEQLSHIDVLDALAACRVFVLTSSNESFPTILLEAMALKKSVVATNNSGPAEILRNGENGFLFESDDICDLAEKTLKAWEYPEIGLKAWTKALEFDWKGVVEKIDKLYESV
jgi:glycosyltransferase involved in cell wall biosynthesis